MAHLVVLGNHWPNIRNQISGIFVVEQIRALADLGHDISVVYPQYIGRLQQLMTMEELGLRGNQFKLYQPITFRAPQFVSHWSIFFRLTVAMTGRKLNATIKSIRSLKEVDAVLVHDFRYCGMSAPIWRRKFDAPMLCLIHGRDPFLASNASREFVREGLRFAAGEFRTIGLVGSSLRASMSNLGFPLGRLTIVANGTELPDEPAASRYEFACNGSKKFLSVANLNKSKGIDDVLKALGYLKRHLGKADWTYRIVGDGPERERLNAMSASLGLETQVNFLGRLSREQTLREFVECDLFCLPSWEEAFGIVFLEAMARGRPVIGCENSGPADFITDGVDGFLVPPKSPEHLAEILRLAWDAPDTLSRIAKAGRATAENYSWRNNALRLTELLGV